MTAKPAHVPVNESSIAPEIAEWVRLARAGNRGAYERLYRAHSARVFGLCLRLSGDRDRARELTQDAFVHAWRKLTLLQNDDLFSTWMYRLTVNLVLTQMRSDKSWNERMSGSDVLDEVEPFRAGYRETPALRVDLERAIAGLPAQARIVFVLHDVEGYPHEEIANRMNIATGTSKAQLHRARRLLREVLER